MLSRRIARASPLAALPQRLLPVVQRRTFLPDSMTGAGGKIDQKYPDSDYPKLTDAEDPGMVRLFPN